MRSLRTRWLQREERREGEDAGEVAIAGQDGCKRRRQVGAVKGGLIAMLAARLWVICRSERARGQRCQRKGLREDEKQH